jgi:AcrR family transcriptional regulator
MVPRSQRADPLPAEARRRAIVEAVIPLLVERGHSVTTRQMADAAGIAEGTIFRVFPDKCALIHEAVRVSIDPEPIQRQLAEIYEDATLEVQLDEAARILLERYEVVIALVSVMRTLPESGKSSHIAGPPAFIAEANTAINEALTEIFERHRDRLRITPSRAAAAFRGLIVASGHPAMGLADRLTINEAVSVLLSGVVEPAVEVVG